MIDIIRSLFYLLNVPIFYLSGLIKRNDNIWIIGAWNGMRYSDNSKYLYEYIKDNTQIRIIWLTKDIQLQKKIKKTKH